MKGKVVINPERCKGCRLCIEVCPQKILVQSSRNNSLGVYVIEVNPVRSKSFNGAKKGVECLGCSRCAIICPDVAIEVFRE